MEGDREREDRGDGEERSDKTNNFKETNPTTTTSFELRHKIQNQFLFFSTLTLKLLISPVPNNPFLSSPPSNRKTPKVKPNRKTL